MPCHALAKKYPETNKRASQNCPEMNKMASQKFPETLNFQENTRKYKKIQKAQKRQTGSKNVKKYKKIQKNIKKVCEPFSKKWKPQFNGP